MSCPSKLSKMRGLGKAHIFSQLLRSADDSGPGSWSLKRGQSREGLSPKLVGTALTLVVRIELNRRVLKVRALMSELKAK